MAQTESFINVIGRKWTCFWMRWAGLNLPGRAATYLATLFAPQYKDRCDLSYRNPKGYIAPDVAITIPHNRLILGDNIFIGNRCVLHSADKDDSTIELGDRVHLYSDIVIEVGEHGRLSVGAEAHIQPRCQLMASRATLKIGRRAEIAPNCAFYTYDHGVAAGIAVRQQPLHTKGGIVIGDDVWIGYGVIVLDGVRIGHGAVIGAGSVVTKDIPENAVALGMPARVVRIR